MSGYDWAIVVIMLVAVTLAGLWTRHYLKGVADFLSAGRSARRYLLSQSRMMSGADAVTVIATFEAFAVGGLPTRWWHTVNTPVWMIIALSGWVFYRFRETRCMTVAQFYEVRYSRGVRVYAGLVTFMSGLFHLGISPAVAATFFIHFCGLPTQVTLAGATMSTAALIMVFTLGLALLYTCLGGQIAIVVTDGIQGIFCGIVFTVLCLFVLATFHWNDLEKALILEPQRRTREAFAKQAHDLRRDAQKILAAGRLVRDWEDLPEAEARLRVAAQTAGLRTGGRKAIADAEQQLAQAESLAINGGKGRSPERALLRAQAALQSAKLEYAAKLADAQALEQELEMVLALRKQDAATAADSDNALRKVQADRLETRAQLAEEKARDDVIVRAGSLGKSMLDPLDTSAVKDFDVWFYALVLFWIVYSCLSWQGSQGYFSSALNPHEQKMSQIVGSWGGTSFHTMMLLLAIAGVAFFILPQYADRAEEVQTLLRHVPTAAEASQARIPLALACMLPIGLKGALCAAMLCLLITTLDTYLHSWAAIFIQDVILPLRRTPLPPQTHVWLLRGAVIAVGVFAFVWSTCFKQTEYILMYLAITSAIIAGLGAIIIGGLYWKRGTTLGAYVAITSGLGLTIARQISHTLLDTERIRAIEHPGPVLTLLRRIDSVNAQWSRFWIILICIALYVACSVLSRRKPFNLERMLHRGKYAIAGEHLRARDASASAWTRLLGITVEFTSWDRFLAYAVIVWNALLLLTLLAGTLVGAFAGGSGDRERAWGALWQVWIWSHVALCVPVTVLFTLGGIRDVRDLFRRLRMLVRDERDDGRVVRHQLPTDVEPDVATKEEDANPSRQT